MDLRLVEPFISSTKDIIKQMTEIEIETSGDMYNENGDIPSYGISSVINFSGKIKGRFVLDIMPFLALRMVQNMVGEPCKDLKDKMFLAAISEMNNIIAGDANTSLNNNFSLGLRLAPPIVYTGRNIVLATSKMTSQTVPLNSPFGKLKLNIGFIGEVD